MTTAWAHLPNARHIDAVLAHAEAHPERWICAPESVFSVDTDYQHTGRRSAKEIDKILAMLAKQHNSWVAAQEHAWAVSVRLNRLSAWSSAVCESPARYALSALIAWDDSGQLMSAPINTVHTKAKRRDDAAILLLPARLAMDETP